MPADHVSERMPADHVSDRMCTDHRISDGDHSLAVMAPGRGKDRDAFLWRLK